jgi:GNAT superfamily N-acetyltransferase
MNAYELRTLRRPSWREMEPLIEQSRREGFRFLERLRREYESGAATFGGPGETLLGVYAGAELVAAGGVSADPYEPRPDAGRIRHLYVAPAHRRQGIGRMLMAALIDAARAHFGVLVLRTDTAAAARFYASLGFRPVAGHPHHTHRLQLRAD